MPKLRIGLNAFIAAGSSGSSYPPDLPGRGRLSYYATVWMPIRHCDLTKSNVSCCRVGTAMRCLDEPRRLFKRRVYLEVILLTKKRGGQICDVSCVFRRDRLAA